MNSQGKIFAVLTGVLGVACVVLVILLIAAKAEVAEAKSDAAAVRLRATERETEANKVIQQVSALERDAIQYRLWKACMEGMKSINMAKEEWAEEKKKPAYSDLSERDLLSERYLQAMPTCPAGGKITIGRIAEPPSCSIHGSLLLR